jgi:hypothetical protein
MLPFHRSVFQSSFMGWPLTNKKIRLIGNCSAFVIVMAISSLYSAPSKNIPDPSTLPPPPSVAVNPTVKPADSEIIFLVDLIPSTAKFINYTQIVLSDAIVAEESAADLGKKLSGGFNQLYDLARNLQANLVVILSQANGISVTIDQVAQPLILKKESAVITAILFDWDSTSEISDKERMIRFTNETPPTKTTVSEFTISLKSAPEGMTLSYWAYGNISRFVQEAVDQDFDTISFRSTKDEAYESIWLPASDIPARISTENPELMVGIYKRPIE